MWIVNAENFDLEIINTSGTKLKSLGAGRWKHISGVLPSNNSLIEGINSFYNAYATNGANLIVKKFHLNSKEFVNRVNFAKEVQNVVPHSIDIFISTKNTEIKIKLNYQVRMITEEDFTNWFEDGNIVPYWVMQLLRAGVNEKFMEAHKYKNICLT